MKLAGLNCEEVIEWVKYKVYEESTYVWNDQLYIFAKQRKWMRQLQGKVDFMVTDSPILLSAIYGNDGFEDLYLKLFKEEFNNMNIFIERVKPYSGVGRNQNEAEAKLLDAQIKEYLLQNNIPFFSVAGDSYAPQKILGLLLQNKGC